MKNILFLCFACMSFFSIGQVQQTNPSKNTTTHSIEKQQITKSNRIEKRVGPIRQEKPAIPEKKEEAIKKD